MKKGKSAYKYAQIKTELSIRILEGTLRPHERIPSLNEITEQYKVSKITARRVLNDLVTEGLVYAVRGKGSFVADTSTYPKLIEQQPNRNIGVVFENASGNFMADIIKGIDEEAYKLGAHINLCLSNDSFERESQILKGLVKQGVKHILLFMVLGKDENSLNVNLPLYLNLQAKGIKILLIDCYLPDVRLPSISWDDHGGMKKLVGYIHEQGCKNIAYVSRVDNATSTVKRFEGFKDGMLEYNLKYDPRNILKVNLGQYDNFSFNSKIATFELLKQTSNIDAILCSDEETASGVFEAIEQSHRYSLNKLRVGGFGNPKSRYLAGNRPYILLEQNTYKLGRLAAELILKNNLNNGKSGNEQNSVFRKILPVPLRLL